MVMEETKQVNTQPVIAKNEIIQPRVYNYNVDKYQGAISQIKDSLKGKKLEMGDSEIEYGLSNNLFSYNESTRGISWQIPRLDEWTRSKDYLINAATWRANQILGRGIDLNVQDHNQELDDVEYLQSYLKEDLFNPLFNMFYLGYFHGGAGGLIIIKGQTDEQSLLKQLTEDSIKKDDFLGIKPLTRLYNIQPCYEPQTVGGVKQPVFIDQIGEKVGIYDATDFGRPAFYRISLNADLYGDGELTKRQINKATSYIVHRSHLLIYNSSPLSFIEERIEQFFGSGIGEKAYVSMRRYENLVDQISLLMERVNVPVLKSPSLLKASLQGQRFQEEAAERMDGVEMSIAYGSMIITGEDEEFEFKEAHFTEIPDLLTEYKKQLVAGLGAPSSQVIGEYNADDENAFDYSLDADSERHLRSMYRQLIPLIYRSKFGKKINDFSFTFKSLQRQTEKEKAEVLKIALEIISIAWKDGVINQGTYHKMMKSASHNISDMLSELDKEYMKYIRETEEKPDGYITFNTMREDLAIALNRDGAYNEVGSAEGGKRDGGNQKATKKPTSGLKIGEPKE